MSGKGGERLGENILEFSAVEDPSGRNKTIKGEKEPVHLIGKITRLVTA